MMTILAPAAWIGPTIGGMETARMYTGPAPVIDLARVYGVTSFELG